MAIGVGLAAANVEKQFRKADAAEETVTWTATSGALGTKIGSGTISTGTYSWTYTRTLKSGESYSGWTSNCIQLGKNGGVENLTLSTTAIPGTIKEVSIECSSYNGNHKVAITVGGDTCLAATNTPSWTTVSSKTTGTISKSGEIVISFTNGSRALYIKSLTVKYEPPAPLSDLTGIEINLDTDKLKTKYYIGESISLNGVDVIAHFEDSSDDHSILADPDLTLAYDETAFDGMTKVEILAEYKGKEDGAEFDVTVIADFVKSLSFTGTSAAQFDIFEGDSLTSETVSSWTVKPVWDSGKAVSALVFNEGYTLRTPNGTISSLPYLWQVGDTTLTAVYSLDNSITASKSVTVTPRLNSITATITGDWTISNIRTDENTVVVKSGSSGTGGGELELTNDTISMTSNGANFNTNYIQIYGEKSFTISTTTGTIKTITLTTTGGDYTGGFSDEPYVVNASSKTFTNANTKQARISSIAIVYNSTKTVNIANSIEHKPTQRAVASFAMYLNQTMAVDGICGTSEANYGIHTSSALKTAWEAVANKYNQLLGTGSTLTADEIAYARLMLANATAKWDDSPDCLQRAMKTYDYVVAKYSSELISAGMVKPNFMVDSDGETPLRNTNSLTPTSGTKTSYMNISIIIIASVIILTTVGAFFLVRRFKKHY